MVISVNDVVIRRLRESDAEAVGHLTLRAYDAYGRIEGDYRHYLADPRLRVAGSTAVLVAEVEHEIVGTATVVLAGDPEWEGHATPQGDASFRVLAVAPGVEGYGVGRRLVTACLDQARDRGRHRLIITSMSWMYRAHRLYEGLGFTRRPDLDVRFPGGIGFVFALDLTDEAPSRFPPPGPVPLEPPWYEDVRPRT